MTAVMASSWTDVEIASCLRGSRRVKPYGVRSLVSKGVEKAPAICRMMSPTVA